MNRKNKKLNYVCRMWISYEMIININTSLKDVAIGLI